MPFLKSPVWLWGSWLVLEEKETVVCLASMLEGVPMQQAKLMLTVDVYALKKSEECLQWAAGQALDCPYTLLNM